MIYLSSSLITQGGDIDALFLHHTDSILNEHSYSVFKKRGSYNNIFDISSEASEFWENYLNAEKKIDWQYLKAVEKKYCQEFPLGVLMMSSQFFTTQYHYRFFYRHLSENEKLYWLQLIFTKMELILEKSNPDVILDIDNSELPRSVLHSIASAKGIPYITLESARYRSYWLPTFTLGRKVDDYFYSRYKQLISNKLLISTKAKFELNEYKLKESILMEDFKNNSTGKIKLTPFWVDLKKLALNLKRLVVYWFKNPRIVGFFFRRPLIADYFHTSIFFVTCFIRERYLLSRFNTIFEMPIIGDKYIYFPLHMIPESTTLVKSPFYPNEISVISAISKALPLGWRLYVKEHGSMIGERPISFYRELKKYTNVRLVRLDAYDDPKPWIANSIGIASLSGTSIFEGVMLGKPALMFGSAPFEVIEGVYKVQSFSELPVLLKNFGNNLTLDNADSCASYLQTVFENGAIVPLLKILNQSQEISSRGLEPPQLFNEEIFNLAKLLLSKSDQGGG